MVLLGVAAALFIYGIIEGLRSDVWGWWFYVVALVVAALWLMQRDEGSPHRTLARRLLIAIVVALALLGLGALSWVWLWDNYWK